jgi:hypothetical protein
MIKHRDSHLDHALTEEQVDHVMKRFADRGGFFVETFTLPAELGTVPCGLYGPTMGDSAIREDEVTYARRGNRTWDSRLVDLPARQQHEVTVIAGPHEETCTTCNGKLIHLGFAPAKDPFTNGGVVGCDHCNSTGKLRYDCILYTAFGGPPAPQEPGDPGCKDLATSAAFWRDHALAK